MNCKSSLYLFEKKGAQSPCIIDLKKDVFRVIKSVGQRVPITDFFVKARVRNDSTKK